jgi:hypothetical protein
MACLLVATSCTKGKDDDEIIPGGGSGTVNPSDIDNSFQCNSKPVSYPNSVVIAFDVVTGTATVTNSMSSEGVTATVTNGYVTVVSTSSSAVSYVVSGTINGGGVKIYSDADFNLILNGTNIVSADGSAINIQSKKQATVTLQDGTNNRLVDGTTYSESSEDMKGTLFSEGQLVFAGQGSLLAKSNAKHAICCDDAIAIGSGAITVSAAAKDALHAKSVKVEGGALDLTAASDCIDAEKSTFEMGGGSLIANAVGKGGKGIKAETDIAITGGAITVVATGDAYYDSEESDISSPACIRCSGNLSISGTANISLSATGKAGKGINADGTLDIKGGTLAVSTTGGTYVYSNTLDSSAKAIKADGIITIAAGTITVSTTQEGSEGIESKSKIYINGGRLEVTAYDDCINATSYIEINGGTIFCSASNNDGIDSNGTITINGGTVISYGTNVPEEGLDCDSNTFKITGGTVIGIGGASSTPTSSVCTQRCLLYGTSGSAVSSYLRIEDASGNDVLTFKLGRTYTSNLTFCISSPKLQANATYQLYTGGSISGGTSFHGLYADATYTKGTSLTSFTASSMVTTLGSTGGPGGGPGGRP